MVSPELVLNWCPLNCQEEFFHNFRTFKYTAIYRIIMSKIKKPKDIKLPIAA